MNRNLTGLSCLCTLLAVGFNPAFSQNSLTDADAHLDSLYWDGPLGCQIQGDQASFHLFAPSADQVTLMLYESPTDNPIEEIKMTRLEQGCWQAEAVPGELVHYYGYSVTGPSDDGKMFDPEVVVADPYSRAVATANHYTHSARTVLRPPSQFDWEDDSWLSIPPEALVIYEAHIRDLTRHESSGVPDSIRGSYMGLLSADFGGGLSHLLDLGINAIEFLPIQDFGNLEVSYMDSAAPTFNTWNPYETNHWGYMTSHFFAPESYYSSGTAMLPGRESGADGRQIVELKQLVKTLHSHGIAVIMDVVYNHVSQYDLNSFKFIDKQYYFRLGDQNEFLSLSGCGNDFKTERPMARRLIVDSILYWMQEFHIDGFRFDLATMIDSTTLAEVTSRAKELNPDVILIAEAWGGGKYDLGAFSRIGWAVWNDRIRNGLKGRNPESELGFVFGSFLGGESKSTLNNHLSGSVITGGGPLLSPSHSVNYLESHDDHTLGDFIRIATGSVDPDSLIPDLLANARLTEKENRIHKLAALGLFCSQGMVMLAQGQEFARSKVIAPTGAPDPRVGLIDHNSYEKDNETNWLNYEHARLNSDLVEFYKGLIRLKKEFKGLGGATAELIEPVDTGDSLAVALLIRATALGDPGNLLFCLNPTDSEVTLDLPAEKWIALVEKGEISNGNFCVYEERISLDPVSGVLLLSEPADHAND